MTSQRVDRRSVIKSAGVIGLMGVAGCLSQARSSERSPTKSHPNTHANTDTPSPTDRIIDNAGDNDTVVAGNTTEDNDTLLPGGRSTDSSPDKGECLDEAFRCQGSPISVERSYTDPPGFQIGQDDSPGVAEEAEYDASNGTVTIATLISGREVVQTRTISFERWTRMKAASVGKPPAVETAKDRSEINIIGSGVGRPPEEADIDRVCIKLYVSPPTDEEQSDRSTQSMMETLAEAAPESVTVTITLEGDSMTHEVPVLVVCQPPLVAL